MYVEPCCVDRQLPQMITDGKAGFCFFQTNGDVTISKFMKAISYLAGDSHMMYLSLPEIDIKTLRTIKHYMDRGWTTSLHLLTQADQSELVKTELKDNLSKIVYAFDPLVLDGLMVFIGTERHVIIQGAMLTSQDFALSHYVAYAGKDKTVLEQAVKPLEAKWRAKSLDITV